MKRMKKLIIILILSQFNPIHSMNDTPVQSMRIKLPTKEFITEEFKTAHLEYLINETKIIERLANTEEFPFTISIIIRSELSYREREKKLTATPQETIKKIMHILFKEAPKKTIGYSKFFQIIPYCKLTILKKITRSTSLFDYKQKSSKKITRTTSLPEDN